MKMQRFFNKSVIQPTNGLDENLMQFNKIKFEQMSHGDKRISEMTCRKQSQVKTGKKIENKTIKDLKVITGRDVLFS